MIKLTVDGVCSECPLRSIKVLDGIGEPIARCEHQTVCKYIEKEGYKDTTTGKKRLKSKNKAPFLGTLCNGGIKP